MRYLRFELLLIIIGFLVCALTGAAFGYYPARIKPTGKVIAFHLDNRVIEISVEAPLPYDALLECHGKCNVKMENLYLAVSDKSLFSICAPPRNNLIQFIKGDFYFSISALPRPIVINTPTDDITIQQVLLKTSGTGGLLTGYVLVKPEVTEIGVIKGGSMVVSTSQGEYFIEAGNQITIARIETGKDVLAETGKEGAASYTTTIVTTGTIGAGIIAAGSFLLSDDDEDDPPPASPSSP
jgi:hypothetical protein